MPAPRCAGRGTACRPGLATAWLHISRRQASAAYPHAPPAPTATAPPIATATATPPRPRPRRHHDRDRDALVGGPEPAHGQLFGHRWRRWRVVVAGADIGDVNAPGADRHRLELSQ